MKVRAGLSPSIGLLLLSTLWAFGWLLPDLLPHSSANRLSLPLSQAILFSAVSALASFLAVMQRREFPKGRRAWAWSGIGAGLFVVPACATAFARGWISDFDQVAVLCLIPIFAVILEPHLNHNPPQRGRAALAGALVAFAGILCLLPLEIPGSFRAGAALFILLLTAFGLAATNCIAVRLAGTRPGESALPAAAQAAGASAICFAVIAVLTQGTAWGSTALPIYLLRLLLVDIPGIFLLFWLMSRMAASRLTARYLLAPLFASLASLALEQVLPPLRALIGLALLAGGAGWLVFAPAEDQAGEPTSLRAINQKSPVQSPREH